MPRCVYADVWAKYHGEHVLDKADPDRILEELLEAQRELEPLEPLVCHAEPSIPLDAGVLHAADSDLTKWLRER